MTSLAMLMAAIAASQDAPFENLLDVSAEDILGPVQQDAPLEHKRDDWPQRTERGELASWDRLEAGLRVGYIFYSSRFHADPAFCGGLFFRLPIPYLWPDIEEQNPPERNPFAFGYSRPVPVDRFGVFGHLTVATIDRDFKEPLDPVSGDVISIGGGLDYTLVHDDTWRILAQVGLQYTDFGGVTDTQDGWGVILGVAMGMHLTRDITLSYNPQISLARDRLGYHYFALQVDF